MSNVDVSNARCARGTRPEEVHALWNIMRQAHDRSPFLSPSGADDHFQKLQVCRYARARNRVCAQAFASVCWCIAFRHYRCARVLCAYMWAGFAPAAAVLRVGCCGAFLARALSPHHVCFPICMPISR